MNIDEIIRLANRRSAERGHRLAERLSQSVLPIFTGGEDGRPARLGSCVLMQIGLRFYAFTAGHVIQEATDDGLWVCTAVGTKLQPMPCLQTWFTTPVDQGGTRLDVGIIPLRANAIAAFDGRVFLSEGDVDTAPDGRDDFAEFYYLFGFPASRRQTRIAHHRRHIRLNFVPVHDLSGSCRNVREGGLS